MSDKYTSKYPRIIIDKIPNSVNDSMKKIITVEEFYDLMHHTHKISDIIGSGEVGGNEFTEMQTTIIEMQSAMNNFKTIIEEQEEIINNFETKLKQQEESINNFKTTIEEQEEIINNFEIVVKANEEEIVLLKSKIETINGELANTATVSDWDVEKPGDQDINGENLGTLMGFDMTEIE